jgi:hypothetical protein
MILHPNGLWNKTAIRYRGSKSRTVTPRHGCTIGFGAVRENVVAIFDKFRDLEITGQREMFAGPAVQRIGLYGMRDTWAFSRNIVHFRGTQ